MNFLLLLGLGLGGYLVARSLASPSTPKPIEPGPGPEAQPPPPKASSPFIDAFGPSPSFDTGPGARPILFTRPGTSFTETVTTSTPSGASVEVVSVTSPGGTTVAATPSIDQARIISAADYVVSSYAPELDPTRYARITTNALADVGYIIQKWFGTFPGVFAKIDDTPQIRAIEIESLRQIFIQTIPRGMVGETNWRRLACGMPQISRFLDPAYAANYPLCV